MHNQELRLRYARPGPLLHLDRFRDLVPSTKHSNVLLHPLQRSCRSFYGSYGPLPRFLRNHFRWQASGWDLRASRFGFHEQTSRAQLRSEFIRRFWLARVCAERTCLSKFIAVFPRLTVRFRRTPPLKSVGKLLRMKAGRK